MAHTQSPDKIRVKVTTRGHVQLEWNYGFYERGWNGKPRYRSVNTSIGERIPYDQWNGKRPTDQWIAANPSAWIRIETAIKNKRQELFNVFSQLHDELEHLPSPEQISDRLRGDSTAPRGNVRFVEWAMDYLKRGTTSEGGRFNKTTQRKYRTTINVLAAMEAARIKGPFKKQAQGRGPIYLQTFSKKDWMDFGLFITLCSSSPKRAQALTGGYYMQSTRTRFEKDLKALLNKAANEGITLGVDPSRLSVVPERPLTKHVLDADAMAKVINTELTSPHLENARRLLVIQLMLGFRVKDWSRIMTAPIAWHTDKRGTRFPYITYTNTKTSTPQIVPLFKPAFDLLSDPQKRPHLISEQKLNDYIKDVCKEVGVDEYVESPVIKANGIKPVEGGPLHAFVQTHTCRRSLVTLLEGPDFMVPEPIRVLFGGWKPKKLAHHAYSKLQPRDKATILVNLVKQGQGVLDFVMIDPAWTESIRPKVVGFQ